MTDVNYLLGIEETRKYKSLISSLYELQDWFHAKYSNYKMAVDINHDSVRGVIILTLKYFVESYSIGQQFAINAEIWSSPTAVDKMARTFGSDEYRSALQAAVANKIITGPEETRKYEEEVEAYEQQMLVHEMPDVVQ